VISEDWRAAKPIVLAGLALLGILFLALLALEIRQLLLTLFLGVILGVTLNPFTDAMAKLRVPRVAAILVVYGFTAAILAGVITYAAFEIANQDFSGDIDALREDYDDLREDSFLPTSAELEESLGEAARRAVGGIAGRVFTFLSAIAGFATILFTAVLFAITQDRLRDITLSFFHPRHRDRVCDLLTKYAVGLRSFARGELVAMTTIGVVTFVGLSLLEVRLAAVLAFIAFVMELIPMIGFWVAAIPAVIVGFTQGPWVAVQVALLYIAIQMFENYVVTPMVHARESEVPALLIFVSITVGGALMGILGALVALSVAVIIRITYLELIKPWNEQRFATASAQAGSEPVLLEIEDRREEPDFVDRTTAGTGSN